MAKMARPTPTGERSGGYAYLAVLIVIVILGITMTAASSSWTQTRQREKESDLLFVGDQFRRAIQQYYESSPGIKKYPASLDSLLLDPRYPSQRRYLRRIYRDPMTSQATWGLITAPEGGVMGVHSLGTGTPLKQSGFPIDYRAFEGRGSYTDWQFVHRPELLRH